MKTGQTISAVLLSAYVALSVLAQALMTNWFRYGWSLEATYVSAVQVLGLAGVMVVAGAARLLRKRVLYATACAAVLAAAATASTMRGALGYYYPPLSLHHTVVGGVQTLVVDGTPELLYAVELRDPLGVAPEVYLRINGGRNKQRIRLPWEGPIRTYIITSNPAEWGTLSPSKRRHDLFLFRATIDLGRPRVFLIDLTRGVAVPLGEQPARRHAKAPGRTGGLMTIDYDPRRQQVIDLARGVTIAGNQPAPGHDASVTAKTYRLHDCRLATVLTYQHQRVITA